MAKDVSLESGLGDEQEDDEFMLMGPFVPQEQLNRSVRRGVSKRVEDGRRVPALWASHPRNGCMAVLGVAHPQAGPCINRKYVKFKAE
jgi:hypothetical protein